jgi:hypothetical protein
MATITWNIVNMERELNDGFVIVAHWTCTAAQDGQSAQVYSSQSFPYNPSEPGFIPYDQLTEAEVIGWVQTAMGPETVAATQASAEQQLNQLINPTTANGLPWSQPAPEVIPDQPV